MSRIGDFIEWLKAEEGSAYVWSAQGETIRADGTVWLDARKIAGNWKNWVRSVENGEANAARAETFIAKKLEKGEEELRCYDCSGLVMRYLCDIMSFLPRDMSADTLMAQCTMTERGALCPGDLVFRVNAKRAYHVGVYTGAGFVAEAAGRDIGVVIRALDAQGKSYWNAFGTLPALLERNDDAPKARFATCRGGSVNVRAGAGTGFRILAVAHTGDLMIAAPCGTPGWAGVAVYAGDRLVTGNMNEDYIQYRGE